MASRTQNVVFLQQVRDTLTPSKTATKSEGKRQMATITFTGASGTQYTFNIHPMSDLGRFNAVQGVYIFTRRNATTGRHGALYIGETGDASQRLTASHEKLPCVRRNGGTHICFMRTSSASERMSAETDLIRAYNPVCND